MFVLGLFSQPLLSVSVGLLFEVFDPVVRNGDLLFQHGNGLRCIYYGKVNAFLSPKEDGEAEADESDS